MEEEQLEFDVNGELLSKIMVQQGSDKSPLWKGKRKPHNYTPFYEKCFRDVWSDRNSITRVLEIGIFEGASLRGWREYFPKAYIYGIDKDPERLLQDDRIQSYWAESTDRMRVTRVLGTKKFDIIIDDGSHRAEDQIGTFNILSSRMNSPGLYFIEDLKTQFQQVIDHVKATGRLVIYEDFQYLKDQGVKVKHDDKILMIKF